MDDITVVREFAGNHADIRQLHTAAFETPQEADLVERLVADGDSVLSLVAMDCGNLVAQALFSRMQAPFRALGLGPVAVAETHRRRGIASWLIRQGIAQARQLGWQGIFVLGDPDFYGRFGFSAKAAQDFACPYAGPYLMLLDLCDSQQIPRKGTISYAAAFADLD